MDTMAIRGPNTRRAKEKVEEALSNHEIGPLNRGT
jgi:hypothetical protein